MKENFKLIILIYSLWGGFLYRLEVITPQVDVGWGAQNTFPELSSGPECLQNR